MGIDRINPNSPNIISILEEANRRGPAYSTESQRPATETGQPAQVIDITAFSAMCPSGAVRPNPLYADRPELARLRGQHDEGLVKAFAVQESFEQMLAENPGMFRALIRA